MSSPRLPPLIRISSVYRTYQPGLPPANAPSIITGSILNFEASGKPDALKPALALLASGVATWPVANPLVPATNCFSISHHTASGARGSLIVPTGMGIPDEELASFFHALVAGAGLRARVLPLLNLECVGPGLFAWQYYEPKVRSLTKILGDIAGLQAHWAARLDTYLALDLSAHACRSPETVRAIHIELEPLEHLLARGLLRRPETIRFGGAGAVTGIPGLPMNLVPPAQLRAALDKLLFGGWFGEVSAQPAMTYYYATRGPRLRGLGPHDLLEIGQPPDR